MTLREIYTPEVDDLFDVEPDTAPVRVNVPSTRRQRADTASVRPRRETSAIFNGQTFDHMRVYWEMGVGIGLLVLSYGSTLATVNGGWAWPWQAAWTAALASFLIQFMLTMTQWIYRRRRTSPQYLISLMIDAGLTVSGLSLVLMTHLRRVGAAVGISGNNLDIACIAVVLLASGLLAWLPEHLLIKD